MSDQPTSPPLALPAPPTRDPNDLQTLEVDGASISLDHLGPMVVNSDGTLSRITGWDKMTEIEKSRTLRVLVKRNRERLAEQKRKQEAAAAAPGSGGEGEQGQAGAKAEDVKTAEAPLSL